MLGLIVFIVLVTFNHCVYIIMALWETILNCLSFIGGSPCLLSIVY